jgi:hypothetical protein
MGQNQNCESGEAKESAYDEKQVSKIPQPSRKIALLLFFVVGKSHRITLFRPSLPMRHARASVE